MQQITHEMAAALSQVTLRPNDPILYLYRGADSVIVDAWCTFCERQFGFIPEFGYIPKPEYSPDEATIKVAPEFGQAQWALLDEWATELSPHFYRTNIELHDVDRHLRHVISMSHEIYDALRSMKKTVSSLCRERLPELFTTPAV